jgi:N-methylhydantoinase A
MATVRIGIDVGGTFTDMVCMWDEGKALYLKGLSTQPDQSTGVGALLTRLLAHLDADDDVIDCVVHGTTVATNTILERDGARTALWTTAGFRDVLHIGRQTRRELYSLTPTAAPPLVPRQLRREVVERVATDGSVLSLPDPSDLAREADRLSEAGIESLAICFINSYVNGDNERRAAEHLARQLPELAVSLSSEIMPEIREYERMNAAVATAYVRPRLERYLGGLAKMLVELDLAAPLMVLQSGGGMLPAGLVSQRGVNTLLSGPAAGVLGAAGLGKRLGRDRLVTADVGGTSFDVAVIEDGSPVLCADGTVAGLPLRFPRIDVHTIGTGGGSVAWVDAGGALQVGPTSAGSTPGPACYGRGGTRATVTDAHVVLGRLRESLAGSGVTIDRAAAERVMGADVAGPLGITLEAAAEGVLEVANSSMAKAIRAMTVERGLDPADFSLVAYGGAGPMHGADLARMLGISEVVIPRAPGHFSAYGASLAPLRFDSVRTVLLDWTAAPATSRLNDALVEMEHSAEESALSQGVSVEGSRFERTLALRYRGQAYELLVQAPVGPVSHATLEQAAADFSVLHERVYGFARAGEPIEIVNVHSSLVVDAPVTVGGGGEDLVWADRSKPPGATQTRCHFERGWTDVSVYARGDIPPGHEIIGPAIVEEDGSTVIVSGEDRAHVDETGSLIIQVGGR